MQLPNEKGQTDKQYNVVNIKTLHRKQEPH